MEAREMSLEEFMATLPEPHRARRELQELMRSRDEWEAEARLQTRNRDFWQEKEAAHRRSHRVGESSEVAKAVSDMAWREVDALHARVSAEPSDVQEACAPTPPQPTPLEAAAARIAKLERQIAGMSDDLKAAGATLVKFRNLLDTRNDQLRDASALLSAAEADGGKLRLRFLATIRWCEHRDKLVAQIARSRDEQP
jgi:hypothetical protein